MSYTSKSNSRRSWRCALAVLLASLLALLIAGAPATADDHDGRVTWATYYTAKPGQEDTITSNLRKMFSALLDAETEAGNTSNWWLGQRMSGRFGEGQPDVIFVTNHPNWAGLETTNDRLEALFANDEGGPGLQALSTANRAAAESREEVFYRNLLLEERTSESLPKYLVIGSLSMRPHRQAQARTFLKTVAKGLYGPLLAAEQITGYGVAARELHNGGDLELLYWYTVDSLAGVDAVSSAAAGMQQEGDSNVDSEIHELFDPAGHRDELWRILPVPE